METRPDAIKRLHLSQEASARFLGVNYRTVCRWVAGEYPIPYVVELLLTYMLATNLTPYTVESALLANILTEQD